MLAFVEEKRETWKMNEGDYLKLSNLMKEAFDSVLKDKKKKRFRFFFLS